MSTSIHPHVEIKINGKWEHYSRPYHPEQQDYDLFGKMAGVRGDGPPIVPPRGLPADATLLTRMDYDWQGGPEYVYSASWLSRAELDLLDDWYRDHRALKWGGINHIFGYLFGNGFSTASGSYPPEVEDVRLVFWFDN